MTRQSRALVGAIAVSASSGVPVLLLGSVGVQVKDDLAIGDARLGAAIGGFFLVALVGSPVAGRLVDILGWRRTVRLLAAVTSTSLLLSAMLGGAYIPLAIAVGLGGLAFSGASAASNVAVASDVAPSWHGLALGVKQSAVPLSTFFTGMAVPTVALTVGWRWAFLIALLLPLIAAISSSQRQDPSRAVGQPQWSALRAALGRVGGRGALAWGDPVAGRRLRLLAAAGALASASIGALNGFSVVTAVASGIAPGSAGAVVAGASVVSMAVRIAAGWLIDRRPAGAFSAVVGLIVVGVVGFMLMSVGAPGPTVVGLALAFGAGWGWPGLFHFGVIRAFAATPGRATGIIQAGFSAGLIAGPALFGLLADGSSYRVAWTVNASLALVAAAMILRFRPRTDDGVSR